MIKIGAIYLDKNTGDLYQVLCLKVDMVGFLENLALKRSGKLYSPFDLERPLREVVVVIMFKQGSPNQLVRYPEVFEKQYFLNNFTFKSDN